MTAHDGYMGGFRPKLLLSFLFISEPFFFGALHFLNFFLPLSLTVLLFSNNPLSFGLLVSLIFDSCDHFPIAESQSSKVLFFGIVL